MCKPHLAVVSAVLLLAGCSAKPDGAYHGQTKGFLGTNAFKLNIAGESMVIVDDRLFGGRIHASATYDDGRILAREGQNFLITFNVKNNGKTLECPQCSSLGMPGIWEKDTAEAGERFELCQRAAERAIEFDADARANRPGAPKDFDRKSFVEARRNSDEADGFLRGCIFHERGYAFAKCLMKGGSAQEVKANCNKL